MFLKKKKWGERGNSTIILSTMPGITMRSLTILIIDAKCPSFYKGVNFFEPRFRIAEKQPAIKSREKPEQGRSNVISLPCMSSSERSMDNARQLPTASQYALQTLKATAPSFFSSSCLGKQLNWAGSSSSCSTSSTSLHSVSTLAQE